MVVVEGKLLLPDVKSWQGLGAPRLASKVGGDVDAADLSQGTRKDFTRASIASQIRSH